MGQFKAIVLATLLIGTGWTTASPSQEDNLELVIRLQKGLHRVGCLEREPDGVWGPASKGALSEFARKIGQRLVGLGPSLEALELVDQYDDQVCGEPHPTGTSDDLMVEDHTELDIATPVQEPPAAPEPPTAPELAVKCYVATVTVGGKPSYGDRWDFPANKAPDVDFRELTTGSANFCKNSYSCQLRAMTSAAKLSFHVVDDDGVLDPDPIGTGQCTIGVQCNLAPSASITMTPCS